MEFELCLDDGGPGNGSFVIHAAISGGGARAAFDQLGKEVLARHSSELGGPTFKEFKGKSLNLKNWDKHQPAYEEVVQSFASAVHAGYAARLTFDARSYLRLNAGFLRPVISSVLRKLTRSCTPNIEEKVTAAAAESALLLWLTRRKQFFGTPNDSLLVFPDACGDNLSRTGEMWTLFGNLGVPLICDRSELLARVVNALASTPELRDPTGPELSSVTPLPSEDCFAIQCCDVVANFALAHFRQCAGSTDPIDCRKAALIRKYVDGLDHPPFISQLSFDRTTNEVSFVGTDPTRGDVRVYV